MKPALLLCVLAFLASPAWADAQPSVLVTTIQPRQGTVPDIVVAFGSAGPTFEGSLTMSLQIQGRVLRYDVTPGEGVKKGQALLEFGLSEAAISTYQQAVAALNLAKSARARIAEMLAQQLATRDQLAQADKAVLDAQSVLDALQKSNGGKPTQTLEAPFDGIVTAIPIAPGDAVAPGAPLITVARADRIVVTIGLEPSDRKRVKLGDVVDLSPLDGSGGSLAGKVFRIDNILNPRTHLIDVDISAGAGLLPGAAFKAAITVGEFKGWLVPRNAVLADAQSSYVFQVSGTKAVRIAVSVLGNSGDTTVVDGPIDPANPLVTQGNYQLTDGMAVRVAGATGTTP